MLSPFEQAVKPITQTPATAAINNLRMIVSFFKFRPKISIVLEFNKDENECEFILTTTLLSYPEINKLQRGVKKYFAHTLQQCVFLRHTCLKRLHYATLAKKRRRRAA